MEEINLLYEVWFDLNVLLLFVVFLLYFECNINYNVNDRIIWKGKIGC